MAINNSGLADAADYVLGRGVVQIAKLDVAGNPGPFRDLGNAPSFSLTGASQTVEHQSSRHGTAFIDKKVITSQSLSCAFEIDEVQNFNNLADWLVGEASRTENGYKNGNSAAIAVAADAAGSIAPWLGRSFLLFGDADSSVTPGDGPRAYNVATGDLVLVTTETIPVTLVDGEDYVLDVENGSVFVISTSAKLATAALANKGFTYQLSASSGDANVDRVRAFVATGLDVAVRFVLENAADDANQSEILLPNVNLASDGDMALIGKDFAAIKFSGTLSPGKVGSKFAGEYALIVDGGTSGS
jgi:hypothetical protein